MTWNWEQSNWPAFSYDSNALEPLERQFLRFSGEFIGAFKHVRPDEQDVLKIELISDEAVKTSEIEGEILDRDSVQSSLLQQFGLSADRRRVPPAERGIAEMMVDLYKNFGAPLTHQTLFAWHTMLMAGERRISAIGGYFPPHGPPPSVFRRPPKPQGPLYATPPPQTQ